ncbi:MAG: hypothetical protein ACAI35_12700 [Candidatus Methylacidiphilales bacterium]|nr:hypothetical protein [Candidatus Methylacidiphilales bacterium]
MKRKTDSFEVLVPSCRQHGCVERIEVQIPLEWDDARNTWILPDEAHRIIQETRERYSPHAGAALAV